MTYSATRRRACRTRNPFSMALTGSVRDARELPEKRSWNGAASEVVIGLVLLVCTVVEIDVREDSYTFGTVYFEWPWLLDPHYSNTLVLLYFSNCKPLLVSMQHVWKPWDCLALVLFPIWVKVRSIAESMMACSKGSLRGSLYSSCNDFSYHAFSVYIFRDFSVADGYW